jgi:hypothetical protein
MAEMSTHENHAPLVGTAERATAPSVQLALPRGIPPAEALFAFAAGAERRIRTLRARIEERSTTAAGTSRVETEVLLERPRLRVTTIKREGANGGSYDAWSTDGAYIEQFSSATKTHTRRRIRSAPDGLDDADLPAAAALRDGGEPLPTKSWAATMLHPGNFCNGVLATGTLGAVSETMVAGRAALQVDVAAPRAIGLDGDRADFRYRVAFDRITGALLAVEELRGERLVRSAIVTSFVADSPIPSAAFDLEIPADAVGIY